MTRNMCTVLWKIMWTCGYLVGNKPPAMVPNKGVYMIKDIQRLGKYYGIPLNQPKVDNPKSKNYYLLKKNENHV